MFNVYWFNFFLIRISGFWKINGRWQHFYKTYSILVWALTLLLTVSEIIEAYTALPDISRFNDALCAWCGVSLAAGKGLLVRRAAMRLEKAQKHLDANLGIPTVGNSKQDKIILKTTAKNVQIVTVLLHSITILTGLAWAMFPLIDGTRKLPLAMWSPKYFNIALTPFYEIFYTSHLIIIFCIALCLVCTSTIYCVFLMQISSHYNILLHHIENLSNWLEAESRKEEAISEKLWDLIRQHQAIVNLVQEMKLIYRDAMLVQIIGNGIMIITGGLEVFVLSTSLTSRVMSRILYIFLALGELFVHCATADTVYHKNALIAQALYNLPWQCQSKRHRQIILVMMIRAQKPSAITVGRFSPLTLKTFLAVLKTAYSVFSLLRQVSST